MPSPGDYLDLLSKEAERRTQTVLEEAFQMLAEQKVSRLEKGHLMPVHVRRLLAIPPKSVLSQVVTGKGCIKDWSKGNGRQEWLPLRGVREAGPR